VRRCVADLPFPGQVVEARTAFYFRRIPERPAAETNRLDPGGLDDRRRAEPVRKNRPIVTRNGDDQGRADLFEGQIIGSDPALQEQSVVSARLENHILTVSPAEDVSIVAKPTMKSVVARPAVQIVVAV